MGGADLVEDKFEGIFGGTATPGGKTRVSWGDPRSGACGGLEPPPCRDSWIQNPRDAIPSMG